jgi:alpha-tubulin suppressor-like RCC1 family protein
MPINESNTIQYTVTTTNTADGTVLYWKTTGNTTNSDIVGGNTGSISVTNTRAFINVTIAADSNSDGTKTLGVSLSTTLNGPAVVNTAAPIIVNDTSLTPLLGFTSIPSSINEGSAGTFNVNSTLSNGTTAYWTINNATSSVDDFSAANGSFTITSGVGSFTVTPSADFTTEGAETFTVSLRTGSISGTIESTSSAVTINDTSRAAAVYVWGQNDTAELGLNDRGVNRSSPTQLSSGSGSWSKISLDSQSTAAIKTDGTLWGWGYGGDGSLGNNNAISRSSPVQIGTGTTWSETTRNRFSTFGIKTDGTLWAWGSGDSGQHGTNNISSKSSPTQVGALTNWSKVIGGSQLSHAIKTDGTLWALGGEANSGLFGNSTSSALNLFRSSPVQIGALTNWTTKMSSDGTVGAIKTDGTLWTWGYNAYGQNADGTQIPRSSPVQVGTGTDWAEIATTQEIVVAIKTGGTLWAWGRNESGQLGFNDTVNRSSPVQLGSDTNWNKVSSRNSFVAATKTDGTLWIWGNNTNGQLGFNDRVNRSSPVQVGIGTTWNDISILNNFASTSPIAVLEVQ